MTREFTLHASIRHLVARYLTDRPGLVVYRDDIADDTQLSLKQVTSCVRALQLQSPIGSEIETVIMGNAWRYVPHTTSTSTSTTDDEPATQTVNGHRPPGRRRRPDGSTPITWQLRDYLVARPGVVVHCNELIEHTGVSEYQVQVGIGNMRRGHLDVAPYIETISPGQSWRYLPANVDHDVASPIDESSNSVRSTTAYEPKSPTNDANDAPRLFEEVGTTVDGAIIVRDDNGALYHATKM